MKKWFNMTILAVIASALLMFCSEGGEGVSGEVAEQFSHMPASVNGLAYINMDQVRKSLYSTK